MRILICVCAAALSTVVLAADSSPRKLSLEEALAIALKQHPSLQRFENLSLAARARVDQARAGFRPLIDFGASVTTGVSGAPLGLRGIAGSPLKSHYGGSVNASQILGDFGKTQHLVGRSQSLFEATRKQTEMRKAWVIVDTEDAYYHALLAQKLVQVAEQAVKQREQTLRQSKAHFEAGLKSRVDVRFAELELSRAQAKLSESKNNLAASFADLNNALGAALTAREDQAYQLEEPATAYAALDDTPAQLTKKSLQSRPEFGESAAQLRAAQELIDFAHSEKRPSLLGTLSLGRLNPPSFLNTWRQRDFWAAGFAISVPLFTGGRIEGEVREAKALLGSQQSAREELEQNIRLQVARAYLAVQTQKENLRAAEQQVVAAEDALNLANLRYQNNLSDIVELTQAQLSDTDARTARATAFYNLKIAEAALAYAVGVDPMKEPQAYALGLSHATCCRQ
jgi:outer membrane protein TolC